MILCNFKTSGANVALEKKVVAQKDAFLAQTDLSRGEEGLNRKIRNYGSERHVILQQVF